MLCLALKKRSRTGINKKVKCYDEQLEAVTRSTQDGSRNFYLLLLWFEKHSSSGLRKVVYYCFPYGTGVINTYVRIYYLR